MTSYSRTNFGSACASVLTHLWILVTDSACWPVCFQQMVLITFYLPSFLAGQLNLVVHLTQVLSSPEMIRLLLWQVWGELSHRCDHPRWKIISKEQINSNSLEVFYWAIQVSHVPRLVKNVHNTRKSILTILFSPCITSNPTQEKNALFWRNNSL